MKAEPGGSVEEPIKDPGSAEQEARTCPVPAARSSSPPPKANSVRFVSYGEQLARNLQRPENQVRYLDQPTALGRRKMRRRLDGLSTMR